MPARPWLVVRAADACREGSVRAVSLLLSSPRKRGPSKRRTLEGYSGAQYTGSRLLDSGARFPRACARDHSAGMTAQPSFGGAPRFSEKNASVRPQARSAAALL